MARDTRMRSWVGRDDFLLIPSLSNEVASLACLHCQAAQEQQFAVRRGWTVIHDRILVSLHVAYGVVASLGASQYPDSRSYKEYGSSQESEFIGKEMYVWNAHLPPDGQTEQANEVRAIPSLEKYTSHCNIGEPSDQRPPQYAVPPRQVCFFTRWIFFYI